MTPPVSFASLVIPYLPKPIRQALGLLVYYTKPILQWIMQKLDNAQLTLSVLVVYLANTVPWYYLVLVAVLLIGVIWKLNDFTERERIDYNDDGGYEKSMDDVSVQLDELAVMVEEFKKDFADDIRDNGMESDDSLSADEGDSSFDEDEEEVVDRDFTADVGIRQRKGKFGVDGNGVIDNNDKDRKGKAT